MSDVFFDDDEPLDEGPVDDDEREVPGEDDEAID